MTIQAPEWFRTEYENRAMHIYQTKGNCLRTTVKPATSFNENNEAVFFLAGKTVARKIDRTTSPTPGGGDRKKFSVQLQTWQAFDEISDFDMDRTKPKENEIIYESGAMALGRATDIEIYDVMKAAKPTIPSAAFDFSWPGPSGSRPRASRRTAMSVAGCRLTPSTSCWPTRSSMPRRLSARAMRRS